jgi:hypothetical protein
MISGKGSNIKSAHQLICSSANLLTERSELTESNPLIFNHQPNPLASG